MSLDTALFVLAAVLPIAMAALGGHLASEKIGYRISFWSLGIATAVVVIIIGIRNERTQTALQYQLNTIQKNTEQPSKVVVNVPPAPPPQKQRAIMALSRDKTDDGIKIFRDPQYPQFGWLVNVSCRNVGTITARQVACPGYTSRIPTNFGVPTKQVLEVAWEEFSKKLAAAHPPQSVDLEPGRNVWGTVGLNMGDVDPELNSGSKVVFVAGAIIYRDDVGPHKKEFCMWAQAPFNPQEETWHFCEIGHNREVY